MISLLLLLVMFFVVGGVISVVLDIIFHPIKTVKRIFSAIIWGVLFFLFLGLI